MLALIWLQSKAVAMSPNALLSKITSEPHVPQETSCCIPLWLRCVSIWPFSSLPAAHNLKLTAKSKKKRRNPSSSERQRRVKNHLKKGLFTPELSYSLMLI